MVGSTSNGADGSDVPNLVPARMVNEFCYCPRLFFLEWVHAQFADNVDTVEGRWRHRVVDEPGGAVPLPSEGEVRVARSVMLSSEQRKDRVHGNITTAAIRRPHHRLTLRALWYPVQSRPPLAPGQR